MRIHIKLCKATVESVRIVAKHLKMSDSEVKDKTKISIIIKIGNVIEEQVTSMAEEEKVVFLQSISEVLIGSPPPLEGVDKDMSELFV